MPETLLNSVPDACETTGGERPGQRKSSRSRNALKHGLRVYTLGTTLPTGASYVARLVHAMRRETEAATVRQHGSINVFQAGLIQSACRHETRALLLQRWLRLEPNLDIMRRAELLEAIGRASTARDNAIGKLGLDTKPEADGWAALRASSSAVVQRWTGQGSPSASPGAADAVAGNVARPDGGPT